MAISKKKRVLWERATMLNQADYVWPWSTWVALRRRAEEQVPHNMTLLMQHGYARNPVVGCWKLKKVDEDPRETQGRRSFIQRRFVSRKFVARDRKPTPDFATKPRFIMTRFKNIPHKVDNRWETSPLGQSGPDKMPFKSRRRSAVSYYGKTSDDIRDSIRQTTKSGKCADVGEGASQSDGNSLRARD